MNNELSLLRVPETEAEEPVTPELDRFTYRSWWCRTFHDKFLYTVGYKYETGVPVPIKVCRRCVLSECLY